MWIEIYKIQLFEITGTLSLTYRVNISCKTPRTTRGNINIISRQQQKLINPILVVTKWQKQVHPKIHSVQLMLYVI